MSNLFNGLKMIYFCPLVSAGIINNLHSFCSFCNSAGAVPENVERRCWGGARSMKRGSWAINSKYIFIWIIKSLYRRISNVYEECGSIIALSLLHGGAHAIIFIYLFFPAERAYTPVIFGCAFCRLMQAPWMERITTMNQLTDIINKSAESLKTN